MKLPTLAKNFPDRQLLAEDVIWIGNDEEGYLSSHRSSQEQLIYMMVIWKSHWQKISL
ncbi:MAG: hypothetical protein CM1200mP1_14050 [Candidatus Neomarinimicrobiota bacterium]|nr:MAG: hypothetical protein CM1200mP1_14050 [Candidatus Neomarinimicrobiota bacterium]